MLPTLTRAAINLKMKLFEGRRNLTQHVTRTSVVMALEITAIVSGLYAQDELDALCSILVVLLVRKGDKVVDNKKSSERIKHTEP